MARIKIHLPPHHQRTLPFATEIPVNIYAINYGHHLGHDSLVMLMHEARVRFLQHWGQSEINFLGAGLILKDLMVTYQSEAIYGDLLRFHLCLGEVSGSAFELLYQVIKVSKKDGEHEAEKEVARAQTTMVFFDYQNKKVAKVPAGFYELFKLPPPQP